MTNGLSVGGVQSLLIQTGQNLVNDIAGFIPGLIYAILVFLLGWVIAVIISRIFGRLLKLVKFEQFLKEQKVSEALGTVVISTVLTKILYYYIVVVFLQEAFLYLNLGTVSTFIRDLLAYLPALIAGVLLVVAAALIGEFIKNRIVEVGRKSTTVHFLARAAKAIIVFLGIMSGLETAQLGVTIIEQAFIVIISAVSFGLALAFGIAFGLGSQNEARDWVKGLRKKFRV